MQPAGDGELAVFRLVTQPRDASDGGQRLAADSGAAYGGGCDRVA
jgi:hypothetical protein